MAENAQNDLSGAIGYHYGKFPPQSFDYPRLIRPVATANVALARYDQMLKNLPNSEVLLAPLRNKEAIVSSRIEGKITTIDEMLRYGAERGENDAKPAATHRSEAIETYLYERALRFAQTEMAKGQPLSPFLLRSAHKVLLGFGGGAKSRPGEWKIKQNYLADGARKKILFVPISPEQLQPGIDALFAYLNSDGAEVLIKTAICHIEFEALHPFEDGNGRIGRMLVTLMLWQQNAISQPHFYISDYFDANRDTYIDAMRDVSGKGAWTEWTLFFLDAIERQAKANLETAESIRVLYEKMTKDISRLLASRWAVDASDFLFRNPVFRSSSFAVDTKIPHASAFRFLRLLIDRGFLKTVSPASGRRPAIHSFEPLMAILRT
jgi:Fic family protein